MPRPIQYPLINGVRHSFASIVFKLAGQEFSGVKSITYTRKRERAVVHGTNPDPLGKTRGKNIYEAEVEIYSAEFKAFVLDHFGPGYGDVQFPVEVSYVENGMDTQTDRLIGCTIDASEGGGTEGTEPLTRKFPLSPTKIYWDGIDDNRTPLHGPRAQA